MRRESKMIRRNKFLDAPWRRCLLLFVVACCRWSSSSSSAPASCSSGTATDTASYSVAGAHQVLFVHSFSLSSLSSISSRNGGDTGTSRGPSARNFPAHDVEQRRRIHHAPMQQQPPSFALWSSADSSDNDDDDAPNIDLTSYATPQELSDSGRFEAADLRAELRRVGLRSDDIPSTSDAANTDADTDADTDSALDEVLELAKRLFTTKYMRVEDLPSDLLLGGSVGAGSDDDDTDNEKSDTAPSSDDSSASSTPDAAAVSVAAKVGLGFLQNSQSGMSNPFAKKESTDASSTGSSGSSNPFATGKQTSSPSNSFVKKEGSSNPFAKKEESSKSGMSNPFAKKESTDASSTGSSGSSNPFATGKQTSSPSNPFAKKEGSSNPFTGKNPFGGDGNASKSGFNPFASKQSLDTKPAGTSIDTEDEAVDENDKDTEDSEALMETDGESEGEGEDDEEKIDDADDVAEDNRIVAELKATEEKARQVKLEAEKVKAKILASRNAEQANAPPANPVASPTPASNPFTSKKMDFPSNPFASKDIGGETPGASTVNPFASPSSGGFANKSGDADNRSDDAKDAAADVKKPASPFGATAPAGVSANPFAKKVDPSPANPFAKKPSEMDDNSDDAKDDTADVKKTASPFGAAPPTSAANPFTTKKLDAPANPFVTKKDISDELDDKNGTSDEGSKDMGKEDEIENKRVTPFGSVPSASGTANPFAKKTNSAPANPFVSEKAGVDTGEEEIGEEDDVEVEKAPASSFGSVPSTSGTAKTFAKNIDFPPANPFVTKPIGSAADEGDKDAEAKKVGSPFRSSPSASAPVNPFAAKKIDSVDSSIDEKDGDAKAKNIASPFGAGPPASATANPFAKKEDSPPANPFTAAKPVDKPDDTSAKDEKSTSPVGAGPPASATANPFGVPPPPAASNPFSVPPKTPTVPSGDTTQSANPFGATPPSPGLGSSASPSLPPSNTPPATKDAKAEDPFAFFAAPPPTMEEVPGFVDPFGKEKPPEAATPPAEPSAAQISQRLEAERRYAERLDAELAGVEQKEAQQTLQLQQSAASPTDQGMSDSSNSNTIVGGASDEVYEEEEEEYEDDVGIEITPDAIDQIKSWDPVSFSWRVGARHFMSNDDFRSLSSPVEMGYGHGFFLRLHLQGPRAGVELRIGDITADLVLRNMEIFLHCRDQYGQRIVAHAAALENGSCASDDDLNSFGCCPFVYENDDGVVMEVSRQMLYQQAKGGGLRIEGYLEVGAVSSYR